MRRSDGGGGERILIAVNAVPASLAVQVFI